MGRTHAGCREDKVDHESREKDTPSLKLMDKIGKLDNRDYIRQLIERGQMNEEQQRIYEDYKKSFLLREEERRIFDRTYTEHDTDKESPYSE